MSTSESGDHILDRIEMGADAEDAGAAADEDRIILGAEADIAIAGAAALAADSIADRLAAQLLLDGAHLRVIGAMAAGSRADWELARLADPDV